MSLNGGLSGEFGPLVIGLPPFGLAFPKVVSGASGGGLCARRAYTFCGWRSCKFVALLAV